MKKAKEFDLLVKNLSLAHYHFCLNQIIHEKVGGDVFEQHRFVWTVVLLGLEEAYLLGLAKFFDRPKELDETVSIYYFFDFNQNELIKKLRTIRNKMIVHFDKKLGTQEGFLNEMRLNGGDIQSLFATAFAALEQIKGNFGVNTDFKIEFELQKEEARHWFEQWFQAFQ